MRIGQWLNQFFQGAGAADMRHRASETATEAAQTDAAREPTGHPKEDTIAPSPRDPQVDENPK